MPRLSVVVCTYNRAEMLVDALTHLSEQSVDPSTYEVLVVDNGSIDATAEIVEQQRSRSAVSIRYVLEPEQGLAHARNRGWREAKGEYVAYTDDDCRVPPGWVMGVLEVIQTHVPDLLGGPYYARFGGPRPHWFRDEYGSRELSAEPRPLVPGEYLSGGNLVLRRSVLDEHEGFDVTFGMSGDALGFGEETEFQIRLRRENPDAVIYYDPDLWVYHLVRSEKISLRWAAREKFLRGRSSWDIQQGCHSSQPRRRFQLVAEILYRLARLFVRPIHGLWRERARYPYYRQYLYERALGEVTELGKLVGEWHARRTAIASRRDLR